MRRLIFMGTPEFAVPCLQACAKKNQIVAVYTQPDRPVGRGQKLQFPPVKQKALELGFEVHQPESLKTPSEIQKIRDFKPDYIVVVAYGQILKKEVLDAPKISCVNVHASLLPRWRGAAPIQWSIVEGDEKTGVCIMKMDVGLDTGDVYLKKEIKIHEEMTTPMLHDELSKLGAEALLEFFEKMEKNDLSATPQSELPGETTYAKKLEKSMEHLSSQERADVLDRKIRGLQPWPGTSVWFLDHNQKKRLKIKKARLSKKESKHQGAVYLDEDALYMDTKDQRLELLSVQLDGKKEMNQKEFIQWMRSQNLKSLKLVEDFSC